MINDEIFFLYYLKQKNKFRYLHSPKVAKLYYINHSVDLVTSSRSNETVLNLLNNLNSIKVSQDFNKPKVIIFFYELGLHFEQIELMDRNAPLAIELEFEASEAIDHLELISSKVKIDEREIESYESYCDKFEKVQAHLRRGDCYQVNLTTEEKRDFKASVEAVLHAWLRDNTKVAPYAHALNLPAIEKLYLSNSPECLFQRKKNIDDISIYTMPIKGTMPIKNDRDEAWKKLLASRKDRAELFMITDLLRNDLSRIDKPLAKVLIDRGRLDVPKIVHQYSLIETKVSPKTSLLKVVKALFPGGSITGAPKKKVMQIIKDLEKRHRGFYCGSTLICDQAQLGCSINIRSAVFDFKKMQIEYGTGGGVTIKSQKYDEYNEILQKSDSFFTIFDYE